MPVVVRVFLVAIGSVALFSFFAWLATLYRRYIWSRLLMWVGIIFFLVGCFFFGSNVIRLRLGWMIAAIAFFALLFGLSAGYFVFKGRSRV